MSDGRPVRKSPGTDLEPDVTLTAEVTRGPSGIYGEPGKKERVEISARKFPELPEEEQSFWMSMPGFRDWLEEARRILAEKEGDKQG